MSEGINNVPLKMIIESEKLEQSASIKLFDFDMRGLGGTIMYFHSGLNELHGNVIWQGIEYTAFPSKIDGIKRTSEGSTNRPTMVVSNITGVVTGLFVSYKELVGAKVFLREVYAKFLDAVNFAGGVNPDADPNQEYVVEYEIQKTNALTRSYCSFELSMPIEAEDALAPKNVITCNACQWRYRHEGCDYSGNLFFDREGNPVGSLSEDVCGKRESDCVLRFGSDAIPIRIFPSAKLVSGS